MAEDVFVKPVIEFIVHNIVYMAIIELLAGLFFGRSSTRSETADNVNIILNHLHLPVEEVSVQSMQVLQSSTVPRE